MQKIKVFNNKELLDEMLSLRIRGYSYKEIAYHYGVDHTSIIYQCKKAGLTLNEDRRTELFRMAQKKVPSDQISESLKIPIKIVDFYISRYGISGNNRTNIRVEGLEKLSLSPNQEFRDRNNQHSRGTIKMEPMINGEPLYKTDENGVKWRRDCFDDWILVGDTKKQQRIDAAEKKKKDLDIKRFKMLKY